MSSLKSNTWRSWVGLLPYFLIPLAVIIIFNWENLTADVATAREVGYLRVATGEDLGIFTLLGILLFIATVLERFLEVFVNASRQPVIIKMELELTKLNAKGKSLRKEINIHRERLTEIKQLRASQQSLEKMGSEMEKRVAETNSAEGKEMVRTDLVDARQNEAKISSQLSELEKVVRYSDRRELKLVLEKKDATPEEAPKDPAVILSELVREKELLVADVEGDMARIRDRRSDHKTMTRILTIQLGFAIGILISLVGFRAIESLIAPDQWASYPPTQQVFFSWLDVMLTGGVIAGGSQGVHELARIYTSFTRSAASSFEPKEQPEVAG